MKYFRTQSFLARTLALSMVFTLFLTTACKKADKSSQGTPESTIAPIQNVEDLFVKGDKEYYVPFQDPDHSYCTVAEGLATPVRSQGWGGCYAYSAVSTMQCAFLKADGTLIDLNPLDVIHRIYSDEKTEEYKEEKYYLSSDPAEDLGGSIVQVTGAMCADPLNGYLITETNQFSSFHDLSEEEIKDLIRTYGSISIGVNYQKSCKDMHGYRAQYYPQDDIDHVATLVGWDDNFPADGFPTKPSRNGAWLVQNTFGQNWGNMGYYWISYDQYLQDFGCCQVSTEYTSALSYGRFPDAVIYSSDAAEQISADQTIFDMDADTINSWNNVTCATVFEEKGDLAAVGFWSLTPNQPYTLEIREGEFGEVLTSFSGTFDYAGYHTIKLDAPLSIKKCTVVLSTAGGARFEGFPREMKKYTATHKTPVHYETKVEEGRSFIEIDGAWVDVTDPQIISKLGLSKFPFFEGATTIGDPCITLLFI